MTVYVYVLWEKGTCMCGSDKLTGIYKTKELAEKSMNKHRYGYYWIDEIILYED